jgi:hypothetical protein
MTHSSPQPLTGAVEHITIERPEGWVTPSVQSGRHCAVGVAAQVCIDARFGMDAQLGIDAQSVMGALPGIDLSHPARLPDSMLLSQHKQPIAFFPHPVR